MCKEFDQPAVLIGRFETSWTQAVFAVLLSSNKLLQSEVTKAQLQLAGSCPDPNPPKKRQGQCPGKSSYTLRRWVASRRLPRSATRRSKRSDAPPAMGSKLFTSAPWEAASRDTDRTLAERGQQQEDPDWKQRCGRVDLPCAAPSTRCSTCHVTFCV